MPSSGVFVLTGIIAVILLHPAFFNRPALYFTRINVRQNKHGDDDGYPCQNAACNILTEHKSHCSPVQKKKNQKQSATEAAHDFFMQFFRIGAFGFEVISCDKRSRASEKNQYTHGIQHRKHNADGEHYIQSDVLSHMFSLPVPYKQVNIYRIHTPQNFLRKFGGDPCAEWALTQLLADLPHRKYFRRGPDAPSPEGNIRMKNKEKPLPQKGAYLVVRDRIHTPQNFLRKLLRGPRKFTPPNFLRKFVGDPEIYPTQNPYGFSAGTPARNGL